MENKEVYTLEEATEIGKLCLRYGQLYEKTAAVNGILKESDLGPAARMSLEPLEKAANALPPNVREKLGIERKTAFLKKICSD